MRWNLRENFINVFLEAWEIWGKLIGRRRREFGRNSIANTNSYSKEILGSSSTFDKKLKSKHLLQLSECALNLSMQDKRNKSEKCNIPRKNNLGITDERRILRKLCISQQTFLLNFRFQRKQCHFLLKQWSIVFTYQDSFAQYLQKLIVAKTTQFATFCSS